MTDMNGRVLVVVPARYASTRFPGKPLAMLAGKTIIRRVVEQVSGLGVRVVVATDDERIAREVKSFSGEVVMTSSHHRSGTDRVIEAYQRIGQGESIVINLQGDEPFVRTEQIKELVRAFDDAETQIATLAEPFSPEASDAELHNPNTVKLVRSPEGVALYFSRCPIPYLRGVESGWCRQHQYYRHVGLYAFRAEILEHIGQLAPSSLEQAESLEQLRWLEAGYRIRVMDTASATIGIDTPEDLERAEQYLRSL